METTQPLARDAHGHPLPLPPTAVAWKVKRQTNKAGRPSQVAASDGGPLVIPIDGTTETLRAEGCGPGWYRLEAINHEGNTVGVVAFVELIGGALDGETTDANISRASVEALARAVEAMQRTQAEREKATAERERAHAKVQEEREKANAQIMIALIERLAPASHAQAPDAIEVVKKQLALQKVIDDEGQRRNAAITVAEPKERSLANDIKEICEVPPVAMALSHITRRVFGGDEKSTPAPAPPLDAATPRRNTDQVDEEPRLEAIYAQLTGDEYERFGALTKRTTRRTVDDWIDRILAGSDDDGARVIRDLISADPTGPPAITAAMAGG